MTKPTGFLVQSFIDDGLWTAANWRGVAWIWEPIAGIGLLFENRKPAVEIFKSWRHRLGPIDEFEQLRVSVIEGDVPGKEPNTYGVCIGSHFEHVVEQAKAAGVNLGSNPIAISPTRVYRLPVSENLGKFKDVFTKSQKYIICPVIYSPPQQLDVLSELAIEKREIFLRDARDVGEKDWDSPGVS